MALMEAAREVGVYGSETEIFKGFDSRCRIKLFGLSNCCKKSSGGGSFSNFSLLGTAMTVGGQALDVGSSYVYDALYDAPTLQKGLGAALGVLGADGMFNPSFSFYGFSFQFLPSQGFVFTGFDPTTLAIQIGVMILQELVVLRAGRADPGDASRAEPLPRGRHLLLEETEARFYQDLHRAHQVPLLLQQSAGTHHQ